MLHGMPIEINLKITDGNIPDNFPNGVGIILYDAGIVVGAHSLNTLFFYEMKGGNSQEIEYMNRWNLYHRYFYNYLHTFFYSNLTKGGEINIPVGLFYNKPRFTSSQYDYKYILNIKKDLDDKLYLTLEDVDEGWKTETKEVDICIINKWMKRIKDCIKL